VFVLGVEQVVAFVVVDLQRQMRRREVEHCVCTTLFSLDFEHCTHLQVADSHLDGELRRVLLDPIEDVRQRTGNETAIFVRVGTTPAELNSERRL
jgi:hypothetical protein